jgi:hypothetical protein
MKTSLLNEIVKAETAAPVREIRTAIAEPEAAGGRLSTAQLLVTMQQLGAALHNAGQAYEQLGAAAPDQLPSLLEQIVKQTGGAGAKAARLLAANR